MEHGEQDTARFYREALDRIQRELEELQKQERQLAARKAQLSQSFDALIPLAFPDDKVLDIHSLTLADAIRLVIASEGRPMRPREIREKLDALGYQSLEKFHNPMASIHTAINRMVASDELRFITDPDDGAKVVVKGPSLKPIPKLVQSPDNIGNAEKKLDTKAEKPHKGAASRKGKVKTDDAASTKKPN